MDSKVRSTLGRLLYAAPYDTVVPEKEWALLVQYVAAGDRTALHELYRRMREPVQTLIERITGSAGTADDLAIAVFGDVWERAPAYDAIEETVVGWIMRLARSRALDHAQIEPRAGSAANEPRVGDERQDWEWLTQRLPPPVGRLEPVGAARGRHEPPWTEVAPGITCKLLATDGPRARVSMLVRLAPGVAYPPHRHAGVEELHLLEGELWIDDRKLYPGSYNRAEPGTSDARVYSETGCTCVLITSPEDVLG